MNFFNKNIKKSKGTLCLNCNQRLSISDNFCKNCGQINDKRPISIKHFFNEYLSGFFSFDNRFFKTVKPLLFKPSKVTREYIEGKRKKYVNPFQLYLHITIVYFLLLGLFNTLDKFNLENIKTNGVDNESAIIDSVSTSLKDELEKINTPTDSVNNKYYNYSPQNYLKEKDTVKKLETSLYRKIEKFIQFSSENEDLDADSALDSLGYNKTYWNIYTYSKVQNLNRFKKDPELVKSYINNITSKISVALFFLLPIFTLVVSLLYIRSKYNYTSHLVFVFHTQTVFFILLIILTVFDRIFNTSFGVGVFIFIFAFYLYKALRNFYKQNRFKTIIKFFILNSIFMILALLGGIIISFLAFII